MDVKLKTTKGIKTFEKSCRNELETSFITSAVKYDVDDVKMFI